MTIRNRELNTRLGYIERCAEVAPDGTYTEAKNAAAAINECAESVMAIFKAHGFKASGCDRMRDIEAALYGYLCESNPDAYGLMTGEGFGEHVDGPAGERILAQTFAQQKIVIDPSL